MFKAGWVLTFEQNVDNESYELKNIKLIQKFSYIALIKKMLSKGRLSMKM